MHKPTFLLIYLLIVVAMILSISCSNSKSPIESPIESLSVAIDNLPIEEIVDNHNRTPMAVFEAVIDPDAKTFTVTPVTRDAQYHFPLTQLYPNCLQITGFGFTPNFWADIKLTHPLPGSGVKVFDPRVIAILPANQGVRFIYPTLHVGGNNRVILEPDGYTKLFNDPAVYGNVNPFIAYFKGQPYRVWADIIVISETQRWQMDLDGFAGPMQFQLVVDISTNYPAPPEPVRDNAPEPVDIKASIGRGLSQLGGYANITVTILDWQGHESIESVVVESPALFNDLISLDYTKPGQNSNEYIYSGIIENSKLAPAGNYSYMVAAKDMITGIYTYREFPIEVHYRDKGDLHWAKSMGSTGEDFAHGVTTLSDNSFVVVGDFRHTVVFGEGETNETSLTSDGYENIFVARYTEKGELMWAKKAGGGGAWNKAYDVTTLSDDSVVVTGLVGYPAIFGEGEPNETSLNAGSYIARYNPDGTLAWAKGYSAPFTFGITAYPNDSVVVTGYIRDSVIFGWQEPNQTQLVSKGGRDVFVARYNSDGSLAWAKSAGSETDMEGKSAATVRRFGMPDPIYSVVVTGYFTGTAVFGEGEPNETILTANGTHRNIFIAHYGYHGTLAWAKHFDGTSSSEGHGITNVSALFSDDLIVTGHFYGTLTFGKGEPNEQSVTSDGQEDAFIAKFSSTGNFEWVRTIYNANAASWAFAAASMQDASAVATGQFKGTVLLGEGEPNETELISNGNYDVFIARYNPDGSLQWAKSAGGPGICRGRAVTFLSDGSPIVAGSFKETATFGPNEPNETVLDSRGDFDIFIARFEP